MLNPSLRCTAFSGSNRIATGELRHVALKAKQAFDLHPQRPVLIFEDASGGQLDLPLELPAADLLRLVAQPLLRQAEPPASPRKPGRPKLGVVAREVTLLPRHWDWLAAQPGGASVALRKLVEAARKVLSAEDQRRASQEAAYRFMQVMAGNEAGFEDAARALFAGDNHRFEVLIQSWPDDVRDHVSLLSVDAFAG
ncbi:DUF2239 family protein [Thermomonas sp.]|uniref:DUF2239 family protein n=1 Tax=Thermomonas sp. TaxID=1971895 RepID=UPI0023A3B880|nr:DUF2239 family protein [Thermomonas sp.]MDE2380732.1 DUF2239 family protein [Xanthomonadaceae bacterium]HOC12035.1 DUF2239 family protein [Thermomonas sp.]HQA02907.1 DUF2239 family protein [Thermomonas sp.]HQE08226.1 DUF2239 family protein [Thermomonas sp.]